MQPYRPGDTQTAAFDASVAISTAVAGTTTVVRVVATEDCFIALGTAPTATTGDMFVPAGVPEYIKIKGGEKVAAIKLSTAGSLYVTELSF